MMEQLGSTIMKTKFLDCTTVDVSAEAFEMGRERGVLTHLTESLGINYLVN